MQLGIVILVTLSLVPIIVFSLPMKVVSVDNDWIVLGTLGKNLDPLLDKNTGSVEQLPKFRVISTNPNNGATGVAITSSVDVEFSLPIVNCNTEPYFWVGLGDAGRTSSIQGTRSLSSDGKTFTFTPSSSLESSKLYAAKVSAQVKDSTGRCQDLEYRWSFTTAGVQPPTSTSCNNNLAIGSVSASGNDGNIPSNIVDGNLNTRWSNDDIGSFITADLGNTKNICSVNIAWFDGDERMYVFAIATSNDGNLFTTKFAKLSSGTTLNSEKYSILPTDARYVRVTVYGNTLNTWASMTELDVFG